MPIVCGVKFRGRGKVYYFSPGSIENLQENDYVVVQTVRGNELGRVVAPHLQVGDDEIVGELKPVLRQATTADLLDWWHYRRKEAEAVAICREQVDKFHLPMKMVSAEYNYDGARLTFFFTSEQRVDFRELVRELARVFKTRIELRRIGVRDEAKIVGGLGRCGRPVCCATWLTGFCPVSIRMAKQQNLPLSPMEISGLCGRLLCCLGYENDFYQEVKGRFPKVGKMISTPCGTAKVIRVSVLKETVKVLLEDGSTLELTAEQLASEAPISPKYGALVLGDAQRGGQGSSASSHPPTGSGFSKPGGRSQSRGQPRPRDERDRKTRTDSPKSRGRWSRASGRSRVSSRQRAKRADQAGEATPRADRPRGSSRRSRRHSPRQERGKGREPA